MTRTPLFAALIALPLCCSVAFGGYKTMSERNSTNQQNQQTQTDEQAQHQSGDAQNESQQATEEVIPLVVTPNVAGAREAAPGAVVEGVQNTVLARFSPVSVPEPQRRMIQRNDLVTIIVRESIATSADADLSSEKNWSMKAELAEFLRIHNGKLTPQTFPGGAPGVDFDFDNKYEGSGGTSRKDSMQTRIQAKVIDVKPNGNLIVEATKEIEMGEDAHIVTLTGECRSEDITAQNTVLSTQIYGMKLVSKPTGAVRDATRRGWLMRIFDFLRPI